MAAWRPTDRDRDPISDQRALASQLQIEVRENLRRICVTVPGTHYGMEFAMPMVALDRVASDQTTKVPHRPLVSLQFLPQEQPRGRLSN